MLFVHDETTDGFGDGSLKVVEFLKDEHKYDSD